MDTLRQLVQRNRSYRRFDPSRPITPDLLTAWLDNTRLTPSARNLQSLRYAISCTPDTNTRIFAALKWAGYLPDWNPAPAEQPSAYIIFCNDRRLTTVTPQIDLGIQAQTLLLSAVEAGYGGCILLAFDKPLITRILDLPSHLDPVLVVALGTPAERCVIDTLPAPATPDTPPTSDIRYYRDASDTHHVPKRPLAELIIK